MVGRRGRGQDGDRTRRLHGKRGCRDRRCGAPACASRRGEGSARRPPPERARAAAPAQGPSARATRRLRTAEIGRRSELLRRGAQSVSSKEPCPVPLPRAVGAAGAMGLGCGGPQKRGEARGRRTEARCGQHIGLAGAAVGAGGGGGQREHACARGHAQARWEAEAPGGTIPMARHAHAENGARRAVGGAAFGAGAQRASAAGGAHRLARRAVAAAGCPHRPRTAPTQL